MTEKKLHPASSPAEPLEEAPRTSTVVKAREQAGRNTDYVWTRDTLPDRRASSAITSVHPDAIELSLRLTQRLGSAPSVVVLSSLESGAGVSTVACELARAITQSSWEPVLLVDANFNHPSLTERLGVGTRPGLAELIRGDVSLEACLVEIVPGSLFFLSTGDASSEGGSLLSTAMCGEIWRSLRLQFGTVIVDSAPVGLSVDGLVVCAHAQYVVLVVEQSRHRRAEIQEMRSVLEALGVQDVGICLSIR